MFMRFLKVSVGFLRGLPGCPKGVLEGSCTENGEI